MTTIIVSAKPSPERGVLSLMAALHTAMGVPKACGRFGARNSLRPHGATHPLRAISRAEHRENSQTWVDWPYRAIGSRAAA